MSLPAEEKFSLFRSRTGLYACLVLTLASAAFAFAHVVGRGVHTEVPPVGLSFWRWLLGAFALLPFIYPESESECTGQIRTHIWFARPARRHHDCKRNLPDDRPELYHGDQCLHHQCHTTRIHGVAGYADPARQAAPVTVVRCCVGTHRRDCHDCQDGPGVAAPPAIQRRGIS